ncbi:hypothetical protein O3M35_010835 [Rhynocoris fuscipes]|uniref:Uncharacterized protein n=1 Tax=Rhynocoris fuscipes TaxID=488301 RepID=A0AAW1D7J3_9HEMI
MEKQRVGTKKEGDRFYCIKESVVECREDIAGTDDKGFVEGGGSVDRNNNCGERGSGGSSGDIGFKIK